MVSDGCVFQPMVVDLLLNPRHIRHSRLSSRCPLCKRNSERNPPSMTSTIDYWFMWRCTFFKIWTVSNASACATKSPCWSSLPHPRRCALVGSWWSCMALSWTTSSTPGCMSWLALVRIQSFAWLHSDCCSIDLCQGCCLRRLRPGLRCLLVVARCLSFRKGRTLNHGGWWKGTYSLLVCVPWHLHREHLGFVSGCSCLMDSGIFCRWAFAKF